MESRSIAFPGGAGHALAGILSVPQGGKPRAMALLAHCFTCTKSFKALRPLAAALVEAGLGVLRFDFTGLGESGGEFAETDFSTNVADLVAASEFLAADFGPPALLVGHSLGGTAALEAAGRLPACRAVAIIASPSSPGHLARHFEDRRRELEQRGEAQIDVAGRSYAVRRRFLESLTRAGWERHIAELGRALLILHASEDRVVPIEEASRIFRLARPPRSFLALDGAGHLLAEERDARYAGALIAAWAERYLDV